MFTTLPIISGAGLFHSKGKFNDITKYPDNTVTHLRTVLDYEIELFVSDGGISHLNGNSYPIKKGNLLLAQPGDRRQSTLHFSALYLHFGTNDEMVQNLIQSIAGVHSLSDYATFQTLFQEICDDVLSFDPDSSILAAAKLITLLCKIKRNTLEYQQYTAKNPSVSVISMGINFMKQYYMEDLSISQIADHCCVSTSYFHKLFVETVHITPKKYLNLIRLGNAKSLLYSTSLSISEIAIKCGFQSQAYFSDCFKRNLSISPKEYRDSYIFAEKE